MKIPIRQVIPIDQVTVIIVLIVSSVKIVVTVLTASGVPTVLIAVIAWTANYFMDALIATKFTTQLTWTIAVGHMTVSFAGIAAIVMISSAVLI